MNNGLILPKELMREIALRTDAKTILILRELYPNIMTDGFFMDYLIYNDYDVHVEYMKFRRHYRSCIKWTKNGIIHNEFGPAIIWLNSRKEWYVNGLLHNENGPAITYRNVHKEWRINNENGPAIIRTDGHKEWYINGLRHNENGPAVILADGHKEWYINDKLHNENGPSIIWSTESKARYINIRRLTGRRVY